MTQEEIKALVESGHFPDGSERPTLVETHASWVILTEKNAFKIKKPVKFSFLDFSTLDLRKHLCEEEVRLNRRLTDIYLAAVPIVKTGGKYGICIPGDPVEYAVKMERLPADRQMHEMLGNGLVTIGDIEALGKMIAEFHQKAEVVQQPFDEKSALHDFEDLASASAVLSKHVDKVYGNLIEKWIKTAGLVLKKYNDRFHQRVEEGFIRDGHGDLHAGNIFLLDKPVIFDCIEFNEHFRINDVLSELAFLAMDLERHGRSDFKDVLIKKYTGIFACFPHPDDSVVFEYYLLYRASVRLKIAALRLKEEILENGVSPQPTKQEIRKLGNLCDHYAKNLSFSAGN